MLHIPSFNPNLLGGVELSTSSFLIFTYNQLPPLFPVWIAKGDGLGSCPTGSRAFTGRFFEAVFGLGHLVSIFQGFGSR